MRRDSFAGYAAVKGPDIVARLDDFLAWTTNRIEADLWSFGRVARPLPGRFSPGLVIEVVDASGRRSSGFNFAAQDYLGLAAHPGVRDFVREVLAEYGPHSAGSDPNLGNHPISQALEAELASFVGREHIVLFPTGWAAAYGAVRALARPRDHVLLDRLSHNCLVSGARAATSSVGYFEHNGTDDLRAKLQAIRREDVSNAILVVSESLFSMDADSPDLGRLVEVCRESQAHLILDVAHDLGAAGERGLGLLETAQLGPSDVIVGTFSKSFCTTGGFVATTSPAVATYIRAFGDTNTFSNTLSPIAAAAALAALRVIVSAEGARLRSQLLEVAQRTRSALAAAGLSCLGSPSAVIPVVVGSEALGRRVCSNLTTAGVITNFMEFPAVPIGRSRLRLQVSPAHASLPLESCMQTIATVIEGTRAAELALAGEPEHPQLALATSPEGAG